jgi:O-antigen/teichoic acid export membrane protein
LVLFEAARFFLALWFGLFKRLFTWRFKKPGLFAQMSYFLPLGAGLIIVILNGQIGPLLVSVRVGPEALALYVVGSFALPIINTFRGAIGDVIFPEMVELKTASRQEALPLWRRATVYYCALLFPIAVIFAYYSDALVTILFTSEYADAVPVFAAFAAMLCISCFEFHLPLRVQNANRYFVTGNAIALIVNAALMYPLYVRLGLLGPAVAFVASQVGLVLYLGYRACRVYEIEISRILPWSQIGKVATVCAVCAPILLLGKVSTDNFLIRAGVFGSAYIVAYLFAVRFVGVWDAFAMVGKIFGRKSERFGSGGGA